GTGSCDSRGSVSGHDGPAAKWGNFQAPRGVRTGVGQVLSAVVIGAGHAGLSAAHHLLRLGLEPWHELLVLDANDAAGGAWQHRWRTLTMHDVHGVAALPGEEPPSTSP